MILQSRSVTYRLFGVCVYLCVWGVCACVSACVCVSVSACLHGCVFSRQPLLFQLQTLLSCCSAEVQRLISFCLHAGTSFLIEVNLISPQLGKSTDQHTSILASLSYQHITVLTYLNTSILASLSYQHITVLTYLNTCILACQEIT